MCMWRYYFPYLRNKEIEAQYRVTVFLEDRFLEVDLLPQSMTFKILPGMSSLPLKVYTSTIVNEVSFSPHAPQN